MAEQDVTLDALLAAVEKAPPTDSVLVVVGLLAGHLPVDDVCFMITDLGGEALWRIPAGASENEGKLDPVQLSGTVYDEVIRTQRLRVTDVPAGSGYQPGYLVVAPVSSRGDALGVLELTTPTRPGPRQRQKIAQAAQALAVVVTVNRRLTDRYETGRRTFTPSLATEIQHNLLPDALTCEAGQATIAGALEPAGESAGDTFDYSLDGTTLHLCITDAMGSDEASALLATLVTGALRRTRRARATPAEQARAAHQAIRDHGDDATVTGQLLRVDLNTGRAVLVNAGHPWPLLLRDGHVTEPPIEVDLPFGAPWQGDYREQEKTLRPRDRLVLFTDGMTERNTASLDLPAVIEHTARLHPREAVRRMTRALREATGGSLLDDATVICLDWHGP